MQDEKMQSKRHDPFYQAQAILSRRDHSEAEVRYKLRKKGFTMDQIEKVLAWLKEKKFINDQVFANRYIETTLRFKAVGRQWLKNKLRQRGVSGADIEAALDQYSHQQEDEQKQKAVRLWHERHPAAANEDALTRFLASRGFSAFS